VKRWWLYYVVGAVILAYVGYKRGWWPAPLAAWLANPFTLP
jgi:hypothetical protein